MASAGGRAGDNVLLLDGDVVRDGAVGVALGGDIALRTLVSQGCRPIGQSYAVTRADRNLVQELGGSPPVDRIKETFTEAEHADRELMRQGLHIGLVVDEYQDDYGPGDFLVRGVMGAEQGTGALAIGDVVRIGQTVRFHVRDAASADADLRAVLDRFTPPARHRPRGRAAVHLQRAGSRAVRRARPRRRPGPPRAGRRAAGRLRLRRRVRSAGAAQLRPHLHRQRPGGLRAGGVTAV